MFTSENCCPRDQRPLKKILFILILSAFFVLIFPLGVMELFSPDETRYAQIAREMISRNDFIVPTLNGVDYFEKPVLGYWCQALSMKAFGENEFAVRLPSALAFLLSAFCVFFLARRFAGGVKTGFFCAVFFFLTPMAFGLGHIATLDSMLAGLLTLSMTFFYFAVREKGTFCKFMLLFLCGGTFGSAFLVKGFLVFAFGGAAILPYLIGSGRWKKIFMLPWIPLLGVLAAVLPWGIAIHRARPDYWDYFFWEEHVRRFFGDAQIAQHHEPFWFFIPVLFAGLGYLVLLLPAAAGGVSSSVRKSDLIKYAFCWFMMPFLFFSASSGKLPTYILPCFAPFALLAGRGLFRTFILKKHFLWLDLASRVMVCGLEIVVVVLWSLSLAGSSLALFSPDETWKLYLAFSASGFSSVFFVYSLLEKKDPWKKTVRFASGFLPVLFIFPFLIPEKVMEIKAPVHFLRETKKSVPENARLLCFRYPFQDVCWVFNRSDVAMFIEPGEIEKGMKSAALKAEERGEIFSRILSLKKTNELIQEKHGKGGVLIVLPTKIYAEESGFPGPLSETEGWLFAQAEKMFRASGKDLFAMKAFSRAAGIVSPTEKERLPAPSWIISCVYPGKKLSREEFFRDYRYDRDEIPRVLWKENDRRSIGFNSYCAVYFE